MVRIRTSRDFRAQPRRKSAITVTFVGPLGHGVGIAADILADVARLARRAVTRDRRVSPRAAPQAGPQDGYLQIVRMEAGDGRRGLDEAGEPIDLLVAWNVEAAMAYAHLLKSPDDLVLLESQTVPAWRSGWACDVTFSGRSVKSEVAGARPPGVLDAVRALGMVSTRLPFTVDLWRHVVPNHVPSRHGAAAVDQFLAAAW